VVLVDTSVWVRYLREGNKELETLLNNGEVMCHPFIIGELACGNIRKRAEILALLKLLPMAVKAEHEEVLQFIEDNRLMGKGLGYVDMHLSASAVLSEVPLWTLDKNLNMITERLKIVYPGPS
jgi:predicted nucleic acid-binding protein